MIATPRKPDPGNQPHCGCGVNRRDAVKLMALGPAAVRLPSFAWAQKLGQATPTPCLIPADKKLSPGWVRSLFQRGTPAVWKGKDLRFIRMPVGGLGCGQLYLSGDGRLWLWDIFKSNYTRESVAGMNLAIARGIHDRYAPAKRNPFNEIECGDHYARAMAAYGEFLAACGYEYHAPKGRLGFAPRLGPEKFKAPFTVAEGSGSFSQNATSGQQLVEIEVKFGKLRLQTLSLGLVGNHKPTRSKLTHAGKLVSATLAVTEGKAIITFDAVVVKQGEKLELELT
jgi:hypothetical protein